MPCKRFIAGVIVLLLAASSTGCWDIEEVNRRGTTGTIFLDAPAPGKVRMGAVFPVPGTLLPPYGSSTQQFLKRHFVVSEEGSGVLDTWKNLQTKNARTLDFTQLRVILFSDRYLRQGKLGDLIDFIDRTVFISGNALIFMCKGDPRDVLDIKFNNNMLPSTYLATFTQSPAKRPFSPSVQLWRITSIQINGIADVYLPVIKASEGQLQLISTALFSKERYVGDLDIDETQMLAYLRGADQGYLTTPLSDDRKRFVAFSDVAVKTKITPWIGEDGIVRFAIRMSLAGKLREIRPRKLNLTQRDVTDFSRASEMEVKRRLVALLGKLRLLNADPVGFGSKVRAKDPSFIKKNNWHQVFPQSTFDVKVKFTVVNTGLRK